jgi:hypothetical protein
MEIRKAETKMARNRRLVNGLRGRAFPDPGWVGFLGIGACLVGGSVPGSSTGILLWPS